MSNPRELYNQYHKALMDAKIEASKQLQKDAIKTYEINQRAKAYADRNKTEQDKIKAQNKREYYKIFVDAMGKMSEFDGKNPLHQIEKEGQGKDAKYFIGVGDERQEISAKAYMQYNTENLNTMKLRNIVMGGYMTGIKHMSEYDPDAIARAENMLKRNPNNPPSGVKTAPDGRVVIKDGNDGLDKEIKQKTDEDLADEKIDLEGDTGGFFQGIKGGIERDLQDPTSPAYTIDKFFGDKGEPGGSGSGSAVADTTDRFGTLYTDPASSTSTSGVMMNQAGKPMTTQEGMGIIQGKGGINAGANVSNTAGMNLPDMKTGLRDRYKEELSKRLQK